MWRSIRRELRPNDASLFVIRDGMSFAYGIAAAVLLMFASVGAVSIVQTLGERARPQELKVNRAYQSAIGEFERLIPVVSLNDSSASGDPSGSAPLNERLLAVDEAIRELRSEMAPNDLSPVKQARLRYLYSAKLQILQHMIDKGSITL